MYIPSVLDLEIDGAFTVIDADTGNALHTFSNAPDEPGDIPPEAATWPILSVKAKCGILVITTRLPKPDPAWDAIRQREEFIRKQTATYTPGTRPMY